MDNGYRVELRDSPNGWRVAIVESGGAMLSERACRDATEARAYASTVRQHIFWLSAETFRSYYVTED